MKAASTNEGFEDALIALTRYVCAAARRKGFHLDYRDDIAQTVHVELADELGPNYGEVLRSHLLTAADRGHWMPDAVRLVVDRVLKRECWQRTHHQVIPFLEASYEPKDARHAADTWRADDIRDALRQLPDENWTVIDLKHQGYTGREIATMLGISPQRVSELFQESIRHIVAHFEPAAVI